MNTLSATAMVIRRIGLVRDFTDSKAFVHQRPPPQPSALHADSAADERRHIEVFTVVECRLTLVESAPAHAFEWQGFLLRFGRRLLRRDKFRLGNFLNPLMRR